MNRFTEIYIELVAAGYSYEEAEKLANIKYEEEAVILNNSVLKKENNLKRFKLMLKHDFKYHKVKAIVEFIEITPDILDVIMTYQSHKNRMFSITYNRFAYKSVERILNGDLAPYYEMTAFFYGTILKMENEEV